MQHTLHDLAHGAHQCGALHAGLFAHALQRDFHINLAGRVQHHQTVPTCRHGGSAGHRAGQGKGGGNADGTGHSV